MTEPLYRDDAYVRTCTATLACKNALPLSSIRLSNTVAKKSFP